MQWPLDRCAIACIISEEGGLTVALDEPGKMEMPHQRILNAISGMVLGGDYGLQNDTQAARDGAGLPQPHERLILRRGGAAADHWRSGAVA
jgi:hypothetical protein